MDDLRRRFGELAETARQGALLRDGLTVVIAGRPNAGKSSLLNRLAGYDAAIVTAIPGTTRDVLRERIAIDGLPLHVIDTAGLRESAADAVEEEGIRRAHAEITRADRVLFVVDSADAGALRGIEDDLARLPAAVPRTLVFNKIDRSGERARVESAPAGPARAYVCAVTGVGLDGLRQHLKDCVGFLPAADGALTARTRHLDALRRARAHVETAHRLLTERQAGELVAEELRDGHRALGEITGEVSSDDLLGRIFSSFCIGK
jgi:tRNA modification GTPase